MCILLVWFLERDIRIETMSSIQYCHIPVEAILNGQMTLKPSIIVINADQCGEFLLFSFLKSWPQSKTRTGFIEL